MVQDMSKFENAKSVKMVAKLEKSSGREVYLHLEYSHNVQC